MHTDIDENLEKKAAWIIYNILDLRKMKVTPITLCHIKDRTDGWFLKSDLHLQKIQRTGHLLQAVTSPPEALGDNSVLQRKQQRGQKMSFLFYPIVFRHSSLGSKKQQPFTVSVLQKLTLWFCKRESWLGRRFQDTQLSPKFLDFCLRTYYLNQRQIQCWTVWEILELWRFIWERKLLEFSWNSDV